MADSAFYMSRRRVFFSVRSARIIPWLIVLAMLALFAFGLVLIVKPADLLIRGAVFPA